MFGPLQGYAGQVIFQGDSIFLGGAYQHNSGYFNDTLSAAHGCDSIIVTSLSVIIGVGKKQRDECTSIFPNPFHQNFNLKIFGNENVNASVVDVTGRLLQ